MLFHRITPRVVTHWNLLFVRINVLLNIKTDVSLKLYVFSQLKKLLDISRQLVIMYIFFHKWKVI